MYKSIGKPNQSDVAQLLDLEFETQLSTREEDRASKMFDAYPCFKEIKNAMDELCRNVGGANLKNIEEMKGRWKNFCAKVQFFAVWKKALRPPFSIGRA
ncbi:hypothetical protein OJAV_G00237060 [Oryzias javanicus]|uniref:Uncharacterized protein n=1 Tax=Oryzias javanicus TaxID=123683 RepID=A0A3S2LWQ7_ORYJA|nr:hypothetical protein OJAV_G00237060 [Oryzias javanicus]